MKLVCEAMLLAEVSLSDDFIRFRDEESSEYRYRVSISVLRFSRERTGLDRIVWDLELSMRFCVWIRGIDRTSAEKKLEMLDNGDSSMLMLRLFDSCKVSMEITGFLVAEIDFVGIIQVFLSIFISRSGV